MVVIERSLNGRYHDQASIFPFGVNHAGIHRGDHEHWIFQESIEENEELHSYNIIYIIYIYMIIYIYSVVYN